MGELLRNMWLWTSAVDLRTELIQLEEEGRDTSTVRRAFGRLIALGDEALFAPRNQERAGALLDCAESLPLQKNYPFREPDNLAAIRALRSRGPRRFTVRLSDKQLLDRLTGAWVGRCCGCLLGKPVEGVRSPDMRGFLELTGQWPLRDYMRFGAKGKARKAYPWLVRERSRYDTLRGMPVDDDLNYTTCGYVILKRHGAAFAAVDVARFWMSNLPILTTCTAERVAYRNLALNLQPPRSARWRNPFREWIGAQIRADAYGYANLGNPERAAEFAWRDASVSHTKNGLYGSMLMAALIAAAPFADDMRHLLRIGLAQIPRTSRLHRDVSLVLDWHAAGTDYDEAVRLIHEKWDEFRQHDWCHTNSNAAICAAGLLWGEEDFGRSICRAVQPAFDTDCNGATVGSIVGMRLGAKSLPSRWTARLDNTLHTSVQGHNTVELDCIARDTLALYKTLR